MNSEEVMDFFKTWIDPKQFANYVRKYNQDVCYNKLVEIDRTSEIGDLEPIINGAYWTNAFVDVIDPIE